MLVTAIETTKRGRYSVYLDGEFYCALHVDVFSSSQLQAGVEVAPEEMAALHRESERRITRERALRLLSARSYTERGLYDKLCERTDEENAAAAIARMIELGLLDDEDYARRYAADCVNRKGYSHRRTAQELQKKGIDRAVIEATMEALEEDPQAAIARVIRRKYRRYLEDEKGRGKTTNALIRLGYRYGDIRAVIVNILEDGDYYEEYD